MAKCGKLYADEVYERRGPEIYDRIVKPSVRPEDKGKFCAIDIDTEDYEIDANDYQACEKLLARHPNAQICLFRVGHWAAYTWGWHGSTEIQE
jgi:hypothetical protein